MVSFYILIPVFSWVCVRQVVEGDATGRGRSVFFYLTFFHFVSIGLGKCAVIKWPLVY